MNSIIAPSSTIHPSAVVGKRPRKLQGYNSQHSSRDTIIGERVDIGACCVVTAGAHVGDDSVLDDFTWVDGDATIGKSILALYGARLCAACVIGDHSVIGGFIGERSRLGSYTRVFGSLVHSQRDRNFPWDSEQAEEPAPVLGDHVFVGFGAVIVGAVTIGARSLVSANAVVTKDVPVEHVVLERNRIIPFSQWHGRLREHLSLERSPMTRGEE